METTEEMTPKDLELIDKAMQCSCTEWNEVMKYECEAETPAARAKLHSIRVMLYHHDEYLDGML